MLLCSIGAVAQTVVTSPRVSTATTTYEYTLECKSGYAHSTTRFIGLNDGNIHGQCAEANALKFQFETATGGYYIFTTVDGVKKYFNFSTNASLDVAASTVWEFRNPFIANTVGIAPVGTATGKALNNNGGSNSLQMGNFTGSGNTCSHWEMKEYITNATSVYGAAGSIGVSPAMEGGNFVNGTKFYTIEIKRNNCMLDSRHLPAVQNKKADPCNENKWAIIEANSGYQFVNKATKKALTFGSTDNDGLAATTASFSDTRTIFEFTTALNSSFESGYECFRIAGTTDSYPNDKNSGLAIWKSEQALWGWEKSASNPGNGDEGSKFKFTMVEELSIETPSTEINFTTFPATTAGTYYVTFTGQATDRPKYLYNDLTQSDGFTLQSNTSGATNNYIWKIVSNGEGQITSLLNGQGSTMKIKSGANKDKTPVLNSLNYVQHNLNGNVCYYLKPVAGTDITSGHDCLNQSKSGWVNANNTNVLTTWESSQQSGNAPDNHWAIQSVDMTGITEYTVQVTGASNGYAIYSGQNAADGGFFLVNGEIAGVQAADIPGLNGSVTIDGHTVKVTYTDPLASYVPETLPFIAASSVDDDEAVFYYLKEKNTGHYIKMDGDNIKESKESSDAIMMISAGGNLYYIYDVTTQKYIAYNSTAQGSTTNSTANSRVYATDTPSNACMWRVVKDENTTTHVDIIPAEHTSLTNTTPALNFTGGTGYVLNLYSRNDSNCGWTFELGMTGNALDAPNVLYATPGAAYMHKLITKDGATVTNVTGLTDGGLNLQLDERSASTYARNYKYVHGNAPTATGTYHYNVQLSNGKSTQVDLIVSNDLQQPTPFMGLLTWNAFQNNISQDIIIQLAEALDTYGLKDVGYKYMCLDDGWANSARTDDHMVWNTGKFTNYEEIVTAVHNRGLKIGLYSDAGSRTCSGAMPGSYGYEETDATDFVNWGFDLLKYDFCNNDGDTEANAIYRYKRMSDALNNAMTNAGKDPKDFLFYMCNWGHNAPWKWGHQTGASCWRATEDTRDIWSDTAHNGGLIQSIARFKDIWAWQGVNRWSDADMMCIGLHATGYSSNDGSAPGYSDGLNEEEEKTQMALWCMWSSPLTLSNNITNFDGQPNNLTGKNVTNTHAAKDLEIIKNTDLIAIDQDEMGQGAEPIVDADGILVFQKDLANGDVAISITNVSDAQKSYTLALNKVSALLAGTNYKFKDLWTGSDVPETYTTESSHSVTLPAHATAIYRISEGEPEVPQFPDPTKQYRIKNHAAGNTYRSGSTAVTIGYLKDEAVSSPSRGGTVRSYGFSAMGEEDCDEGIFVFEEDGNGHYYLKSVANNRYVKKLADGALPAVTTTADAAAFNVTTTDGSYIAADGTYFLIDSKATTDVKYLQACDDWWGGGAAAWKPTNADNKLRCEWIIEEVIEVEPTLAIDTEVLYRFKNRNAGVTYTSSPCTVTLGYMTNETVTSPNRGGITRTYGFSACGAGNDEASVFKFEKAEVIDGVQTYYINVFYGEKYVARLVDGGLDAAASTDNAGKFKLVPAEKVGDVQYYYFIDVTQSDERYEYMQACDAWWGGGIVGWGPYGSDATRQDNDYRCQWALEVIKFEAEGSFLRAYAKPDSENPDDKYYMTIEGNNIVAKKNDNPAADANNVFLVYHDQFLNFNTGKFVQVAGGACQAGVGTQGNLQNEITTFTIHPVSDKGFNFMNGDKAIAVDKNNTSAALAESATTGYYKNVTWYFEPVATAPVQLSPSGLGTFYAPVATQVVGDGVKAYYAKDITEGEEEAVIVYAELNDNEIPAERAALIEGDKSGSFSVKVIKETSNVVDDSQFKGYYATVANTQTSSNHGAFYYYTLAGDGYFKYYTGTTFKGFRGVLALSHDYRNSQGSAVRLILNDEILTGVDFLETAPVEEMGTIYDLQGRRVKNANSGLYIVNGKKVIR